MSYFSLRANFANKNFAKKIIIIIKKNILLCKKRLLQMGARGSIDQLRGAKFR